MVPFRRPSQRGRRSVELRDRDSYEWPDERDTRIMTATFPIHPIASMQAPFEESMLDATGETGHVPFANPKKSVKTRQQLLCREESATEPSWNFTYNCHWRHNPKGKFHPLMKTVAQIIFGVHLLHQHLEKSVADVADILLKHVNELDSFLQRANEDLESSMKDMLFRHKCLKVPMEHVNEFDRLLEDRSYRAQLLDGNIVIERTIGRMSQLLNDYLIDINIFREANQELDMYLADVGDAWTYRNEDIGRIYSAMCGNTGGWSQFLQSLVAKAERLGVVLVQVSSYCNEIEKRCGAASRRSLIATRTSSRNSSNSREGRSFRNFANNKPLPTPPPERPPFMSPSSGRETPASFGTPQRQSTIKAKPQHQPEIVNTSDSATETPKRSEDSSSMSAVSNVDVDVPRQTSQHEYYQDAWHNDEQRGRATPQAESSRTHQLMRHQENTSSSNLLAEERPSATEHSYAKPDNGDYSPPLTGKDSAYSSVSGTSAMSPAYGSPRSASSMSSRQTAQFGLFPSRNLTTPKGSISSRLGATSPAFDHSAQPPKPVDMPSRPQTSLSTFSDASTKRLSKRNKSHQSNVTPTTRTPFASFRISKARVGSIIIIMMLSDRDPNGGGRTSRASNLSTLSRTSGKTAHRAPSSDFPASVGRGVSSMLRTETEMGNVGGGVLDDLSGIGNMHRPLQRQRAPSRMSTASSMSNTSSRNSKHLRGYPSSSSAPRHSTGPGGPQYVSNTLSPAMLNNPMSSPLNGMGSRDRDSHRSRSMTHDIQPPYSLSSNRSLTSLRPPHGLQPQNLYAYPNPNGSGLRPLNPNHRPISPALSDSTGLRLRTSNGFEEQRMSSGGHSQTYANTGRPHNRRTHRDAGQGQQYRGLGNPHNVGQMRARLPSQPSALSLEHRREEEDCFPLLAGPAYEEQMEGLHSGNPYLHRDQLTSRHHDPRSEAPPLPVNHRQRIAVEQARFKRSAPGSMSSGSTNLRADSDAPSSDMTSPPTPRDGASMAVLQHRDGTRVIKFNGMSPNKLEEKTSVPYYDYSEQFDRNEDADTQGEAIPTGFVHRTKTIIEECGPTDEAAAALKSDSFLGQEAQPMSMVVVSPQTKSIAKPANVATTANDPNTTGMAGIAELPASPVARRITRDLILRGLEVSMTGDIQSSTKCPSTSPNNDSTQSDELPVQTRSATEREVAKSQRSIESKDNRHSILSQTGSSILNSSTLDFAVRHSIPAAKGGGFDEEVAEENGGSVNMSASPGRSTEDGMSDVLAGYQGTDSKAEPHVLLPDASSAERNTISAGSTATSKETDLKPLQLMIRSASNHAQKSSDEQSFKSCTDLPDEPSDMTSSKMEKDHDGKTFGLPADMMPEREASLKESDAHSFSTAKVTASPDRVAFVIPPRLPSSNLGTMVINKSKAEPEMPLSRPPAALLRKQPPVPRRESSFSVVANKLKTNSRSSVKHGSVSASGSSSTLSIAHMPPAVPPRESSTSKEAQRVHAAVSFLMRPLPSRFSKGLKRADQDDALSLPETDLAGLDCIKDVDLNATFKGAVASLPIIDFVPIVEKVSSTPAGVPSKTRAISLDTTEICNPYKVLGVSPGPVGHQHTSSTMPPGIPEPSSVYSIHDNSSRSYEDPCPAGVSGSMDSNRRDSQTTTHLEWQRCVPPATSTAPQFAPPRPSSGVGSHLDARTLTPLINIQEDTTTDLRLSGYRYPGPSRYLPDLKEESHEDSSLNTSASNLKSSSFRFPFGAPSGIRASGDDPVNFSRRSSMASHRRSGVDSNVGSTLAQAHGLPSMRFSRMNLFDGLTDELGLRYSRSMEEVPHVSQRLSRGSPPRPASTGDVTDLRISLAELEEVERSRFSMQPTTMMSLLAMHRARSPELMAEIERLTIPSVGGLTQRFSEFFPSLREYYQCGEPPEFPIEEEIEKHALDEIHEIHPTQKRSSARLRPMRGVSHMVVIEDDLYDELTGKEKENDSRGRTDDVVAEVDASEAGSTGEKLEKAKDVRATPAHHQTAPLPGLQVPSPAILRPRSHTVDPQALRISGDPALSSRRSLRSFISTPTATETRPWNSDKNYPWATSTSPVIDISLPPPTAARHSPRPGPSRLRNRLSDESTTSSFSTAQTATLSPFGSPADSTAHARHHRFSAFGRNSDQPHEVGERYPTSALSPPTAIFRDHLSASDTSDDDNYDTTRKTRLSLRKRFSSTRKVTLDSQTNTRAGRSKVNAQGLASPESTQPSATSIVQDSAGEAQAFVSTSKANRHTFRDAKGMRPSKHQFVMSNVVSATPWVYYTIFKAPNGLIYLARDGHIYPSPFPPPPPPNTPEPQELKGLSISNPDRAWMLWPNRSCPF
ncbi:hypothetical protein DDE82_001653 [Stemphylium lycopersici]|nr:hypothetical protein DDE82_001653 [Stemphylium lycopersici]